MDSETIIPLQFQPFNWLHSAKILNKKGELIPAEWLEENAEIIVLLFTSKGIDREGIIKKFYTIYESVKVLNIAIEVIYVPFDETEEDYNESYEEQANWFTLKYDAPVVTILKYAYEITSIPRMIVMRSDCSVISSHAMLDLEAYGKNAVITWLTNKVSSKKHRRMSKDAQMYGESWKYASTGAEKKPVKMRFSQSSGFTSTSSKKK